MSPVRCIVGLGNPGAQYAGTRHNAGAWFISALVERYALTLKSDTKFRAALVKTPVFGDPCWIVQPNTYMNESGKAVAAVSRFYKIPPEAILVVHDELDFPAGTIRIKQAGGHGGHNGLRDIVSAIGSKDFYRLRVGIGHPGSKHQVSSYVLNKPMEGDRIAILRSIDEGMDILADLVAGQIQRAFHQLHSDDSLS